MLPFVLIPAAAGSLLGMLLTRYFPRSRGRVLGLGFALLTALAVVLAWYAGFFSYSTTVDEQFVDNVLACFRFSQSAWAPSFWVSEGIMSASRGEWGPAAFNLGLLIATAFFLWAVADLIAEKIYASSFSRATGSPSRRYRRTGGLIDTASDKLARIAPFTARLVAKDLRTFLRDPVQYSQVLIFFGLLFLYVANLRNLGYQSIVLEHISSLRWTNFVAFTNLAAAGLTLATLTTRFVYPLISMEGKRFWVLSLMPVKRSRLLLGKYIFALGGSLFLIVPLVALSSYMLGSNVKMAWMHAVTALALCLGLPGIAVGMGAVFPNFREDSPSKIVSGFGGTLCLIMSVGFVASTVMGVGLLCRQWARAQEGIRIPLNHPLSLAVLLAVGMALAATVLPLVLGCRAINRAEL